MANRLTSLALAAGLLIAAGSASAQADNLKKLLDFKVTGTPLENDVGRRLEGPHLAAQPELSCARGGSVTVLAPVCTRR